MTMNHQMCFQKFDIIAMYWLFKHISNGKRNGFTSLNVDFGFGLVCLSLLLNLLSFSSLQQQQQLVALRASLGGILLLLLLLHTHTTKKR